MRLRTAWPRLSTWATRRRSPSSDMSIIPDKPPPSDRFVTTIEFATEAPATTRRLG
jgi:hypothetical protein